MKTVNASSTTELVDSLPATPAAPPKWTVPSIINIPPQISTTLVWVGVGFALGIGLMIYMDNKRRA